VQTTSPVKPQAPFAGGATGHIRSLLRVENAAIALIACAAYYASGGSFGLFLALILVPDVAMLGYLHGPKLGSLLYNLTHTYTFPLLLGSAAEAASNDTAMLISLIWFGHIGIDRAVGFGLKYASAFGDTHLGRLSARRRAAGQPGPILAKRGSAVT
jgi:hypothetical protein